MIQRGKKSAAAGVAPRVIDGGFRARPDPPDDLTARQAELWRLVVASEAPDFFASAALKGLLSDYCRRREAAELVSEIINQFRPDWLKSGDGARRYALLLRMRDVEVKGVASLATKLRLTNQSRYRNERAERAARDERVKVAKPWDL